MDIHEIRKQNLKLLILKFGTAAGLAAQAGTSANYLSQVQSPKTGRNIGYNVARRLEKAGGKEVGWMDRNHSEELSAELSALAKLIALVPTERLIEGLRVMGIEWRTGTGSVPTLATDTQPQDDRPRIMVKGIRAR